MCKLKISLIAYYIIKTDSILAVIPVYVIESSVNRFDDIKSNMTQTLIFDSFMQQHKDMSLSIKQAEMIECVDWNMTQH